MKASGAFGAFCAGVSGLAYAVSGFVAVFGGIRVTRAVLGAEGVAFALATRTRGEATHAGRSEEAAFAEVAIHAGRVVATVDAHAAAFESSGLVEAAAFGLHLRIEEAFIGVSEALTPFAFVAGDKLSGSPALLIVHGATTIAKRPARVMPTTTLVMTDGSVENGTFFGVAVARTLTADGNIAEAVKILPQSHFVDEFVKRPLILRQHSQSLQPNADESRPSEVD